MQQYVKDAVAGLRGERLFAVNAFSAAVGFPPASVMNFTAGAQHGTMYGTLLFVLSNVLGGVVAMLVIRMLLRGYILRRMGGYENKWRAIGRAIEREGAFTMVTLMRLSPVVPFSPMTALLALTPVGMLDFVTGSALGLLPFTLVYSYIGSVGQQTASSGEWDPVQLGLVVFGLLVTVVLTRRIGRVAQNALDGPKAS